MLANKESLKSRIENMFWLNDDWDGFGSSPISKKSHDISILLISYISVDATVKVLVGVEIPGSVHFDIFRETNRKFEMIVKPDGEIEYTEYDIKSYKILSQGAFILTSININEILA